MRIFKVFPAAALALAGIAVLLFVVAPLGTRLGWWHYRFGLYWLMPGAGFVGAAAVVLSGLALTTRWQQLRVQGRVMLCLALAVGMGVGRLDIYQATAFTSLLPH